MLPVVVNAEGGFIEESDDAAAFAWAFLARAFGTPTRPGDFVSPAELSAEGNTERTPLCAVGRGAAVGSGMAAGGDTDASTGAAAICGAAGCLPKKRRGTSPVIHDFAAIAPVRASAANTRRSPGRSTPTPASPPMSATPSNAINQRLRDRPGSPAANSKSLRSTLTGRWLSRNRGGCA